VSAVPGVQTLSADQRALLLLVLLLLAAAGLTCTRLSIALKVASTGPAAAAAAEVHKLSGAQTCSCLLPVTTWLQLQLNMQAHKAAAECSAAELTSRDTHAHTRTQAWSNSCTYACALSHTGHAIRALQCHCFAASSSTCHHISGMCHIHTQNQHETTTKLRMQTSRGAAYTMQPSTHRRFRVQPIFRMQQTKMYTSHLCLCPGPHWSCRQGPSA
jgi:hypothetical protein